MGGAAVVMAIKVKKKIRAKSWRVKSRDTRELLCVWHTNTKATKLVIHTKTWYFHWCLTDSLLLATLDSMSAPLAKKKRKILKYNYAIFCKKKIIFQTNAKCVLNLKDCSQIGENGAFIFDGTPKCQFLNYLQQIINFLS